MAKNDALLAMGLCLHQDIHLGASNEVELAQNVIALLSPSERAALHQYLAGALERLTPSELKGELNRATPDWRFSSKSADAFLRVMFKQLEG